MHAHHKFSFSNTEACKKWEIAWASCGNWLVNIRWEVTIVFSYVCSILTLTRHSFIIHIFLVLRHVWWFCTSIWKTEIYCHIRKSINWVQLKALTQLVSKTSASNSQKLYKIFTYWNKCIYIFSIEYNFIFSFNSAASRQKPDVIYTLLFLYSPAIFKWGGQTREWGTSPTWKRTSQLTCSEQWGSGRNGRCGRRSNWWNRRGLQ